MSFTIEIDNANKIVRYTHSGQITRDDIGKAWDELLKLEEFTVQKFNLLSDYSNAILSGTAEDVKIISDTLFMLKDMLAGKKQAMIHLEPRSTALSLLFQDEIYNRIGFIIKIFAGEDAAVQWLTSENL